MAMAKRHFEKLARILRDEAEHAARNCPPGLYREGRNDALDAIKTAIADMCGDENSRFERDRFFRACLPSTPKE